MKCVINFLSQKFQIIQIIIIIQIIQQKLKFMLLVTHVEFWHCYKNSWARKRIFCYMSLELYAVTSNRNF